MADLAGTSRDRLTFVSWAGQGLRSRKTYWNMACSCGTRFLMQQDARQKSCGCLNKEKIATGERFKLKNQPDGRVYHSARMVQVDGKPMHLTEACRKLGFSVRTVQFRIRLGWPQERWFEEPRLPYRKLWRWRRLKKMRERAYANR